MKTWTQDEPIATWTEDEPIETWTEDEPVETMYWGCTNGNRNWGWTSGNYMYWGWTSGNMNWGWTNGNMNWGWTSGNMTHGGTNKNNELRMNQWKHEWTEDEPMETMYWEWTNWNNVLRMNQWKLWTNGIIFWSRTTRKSEACLHLILYITEYIIVLHYVGRRGFSISYPRLQIFYFLCSTPWPLPPPPIPLLCGPVH